MIRRPPWFLRWRLWGCLSSSSSSIGGLFTSFVRSSASTNRHACRSSRTAGLSCSGEALITLRGVRSSSYLAPRPCMFQVSIGDVLVSPGMLPSLCARLQFCLLEGTSVQLRVWCPVLSKHSVCPNEASTSFLRLSEPSPPVRRLCRAETNCSRRDLDSHWRGSLGFLN